MLEQLEMHYIGNLVKVTMNLYSCKTYLSQREDNGTYKQCRYSYSYKHIYLTDDAFPHFSSKDK